MAAAPPRRLVAAVVAVITAIAVPLVALSAVWNTAPTTGSAIVSVQAMPIEPAVDICTEGDAGGLRCPVEVLSIESWPSQLVHAAVHSPGLAAHGVALAALVLAAIVAVAVLRGRSAARIGTRSLLVLAVVALTCGLTVPRAHRWGLEQVVVGEGLQTSREAAVSAGSVSWVTPLDDGTWIGTGFLLVAAGAVLAALLVAQVRSERAQAYL